MLLGWALVEDLAICDLSWVDLMLQEEIRILLDELVLD
jgi:hypothetical protein